MQQPNLPKISESEWAVMKVIWGSAPITAEEIKLRLPEDNEWSEGTVRTFVNRLLKKGAIGFEKSGRTYLYYPLVSEQECVRSESRSFLKRVFGGAADLMMTNFLEEVQLSDQEIERLQRMLADKQQRKNGPQGPES
ncbi:MULTISPECIES: BlaI/MecI/CopY family transcriptional regulator [Paenibacillus]|uniref:BlaI/MecI/CopY family transcriptional regulator n=1 Tax=Paenibacillus TaxID=44249 RepID=UPI0022B8CE87|nr:BlaI/MecI/CopY family transcriptional regulator [Paenibacillus caseinilyticus]MCZ8521901.1 BlaI/MecI/CopY family transcriptional regulator [Paenibacillus caseinilyticus]